MCEGMSPEMQRSRTSADRGYLQALDWLVKLGKHGHAAKWLSLALVVVGFHFDLLAS